MVEIPQNIINLGAASSPSLPAAPEIEAAQPEGGIESPSDSYSETAGQAGTETMEYPFPDAGKSPEAETDERENSKLFLKSSAEFVPMTFKEVIIKQLGYYYKVTVPKSWRFDHTANTMRVYDPCNRNICVSFMWANGSGKMDSASLIQKTVEHNDIQNYEVLSSTPEEIISTPPGLSKSMEQEATFSYRGELCHNQVTSTVYDTNNPFNLFWTGSLIWRQAPDEKWDEYKNTLNNIAASFTKTSAPKPDPCDCGHGPGCGCGCQHGFIHSCDG